MDKFLIFVSLEKTGVVLLRRFRKILIDVIVLPRQPVEDKKKNELYEQIVIGIKTCESRVDSILDLYSRRRLRDTHLLLQNLALDFTETVHLIEFGKKRSVEPSLRLCAEDCTLRRITGLGNLIDYCLQQDGSNVGISVEPLETILKLLPTTLYALRVSARFRATGWTAPLLTYFQNDTLRKIFALFVCVFIITSAALLAFTCVDHFVFRPVSTYIASLIHFDWIAKIIPQQFNINLIDAVELDQHGQQFAWGHGPQSWVDFFSPVDQKMRIVVSMVSPLPGQEVSISVNGMLLGDWRLSVGDRMDKLMDFSARKGNNIISFRYSNWNMKSAQLFHNEGRPLAVQFYILKIDKY